MICISIIGRWVIWEGDVCCIDDGWRGTPRSVLWWLGELMLEGSCVVWLERKTDRQTSLRQRQKVGKCFLVSSQPDNL